MTLPGGRYLMFPGTPQVVHAMPNYPPGGPKSYNAPAPKKNDPVLLDVTDQMRESFIGASMLRNLTFEAMKVYLVADSPKDRHVELLTGMRAVCKGKLGAFTTDHSLKIALENPEDVVFLKMFFG